MPDGASARFERIVASPDEDLNLAEAALLIAVGGYLKRLDELAAKVRGLAKAQRPDRLELVLALNHCLFQEEHFAGNAQDYADPRNSFLNEVLDRRLGIPITLSLIYMEVGWRVGLPVEGVSFPGHFLVKIPHKGGHIVLDPFFKGASLGADDLAERLRHVMGENVDVEAYLPHMLEGVGKREILVRMLRNLKHSYVERGDDNRALATLNRILVTESDLPGELRDRARLYDKLNCFRAALADYCRYVEVEPKADDEREVRARIAELRVAAARLN
jgi:regulator of sirC expression with transglutaminase-like and TPR domain